MKLVHRRHWVQRTIFSRLPFGQPFYLASDKTTPLIKVLSTGRANTWDTVTGALSTTAVAGNVAVIEIPRFLLVQQ